MPENPFSRPSTLPYQMPPFDRVRNADYRPGFEEGMRQQREEVRQIVETAAPADFANTVVALERSGLMLNRVSSVFFNLNASNTDAEMEAIDSEIAPKLQAHEDAIFLEKGVLAPSNAAMVEKARGIVESLGGRIATANQAREMLALPMR